jgi:hypothetical protein
VNCTRRLTQRECWSTLPYPALPYPTLNYNKLPCAALNNTAPHDISLRYHIL